MIFHLNIHDIHLNIIIKLHFLKSHFQHFPDNLGDYSEEQGKRFHQDIEQDP